LNSTEEIVKASRKRTRRSFLVAGIAAAGGYEFYRWIARAPGDQMQPRPLRTAFNFNEEVSRGLFKVRGNAPTYPVSKAEDLRVNGNYGLKQELLLDSFRLQVVGLANARSYSQYTDDVTAWEYKYKTADVAYTGHDTKEAPKPKAAPSGIPMGSAKDMTLGAGAKAGGDTSQMLPQFAAALAEQRAGEGKRADRGQEEAGESDSTLDPGTPGLLLRLDDMSRFTRHDLVTQFKCIEGWSQIVHWGGVPLRDFIEAYPPARDEQGRLPQYVYMETPNGDYYCGFHLEDCMHPQSMLVTELSGRPLAPVHGAPIRLHMPIKYGYKQIKRIGLIAYTNDKPDDYWTKLGYDWYAGL
jgi:hypothetical protein